MQAYINDRRAPNPLTIKGPVTGKTYEITRKGVEIEDEDARGIRELEVPIYCMRLRQYIKVKIFSVGG